MGAMAPPDNLLSELPLKRQAEASPRTPASRLFFASPTWPLALVTEPLHGSLLRRGGCAGIADVVLRRWHGRVARMQCTVWALHRWQCRAIKCLVSDETPEMRAARRRREASLLAAPRSTPQRNAVTIPIPPRQTVR